MLAAFALFVVAARTAELNQILASPSMAGATLSVDVTDSSGRVIYSHDAARRVTPASNEKLFSAAFALYQLGPTYRPVTRIWKLPGRVVVGTQGDPLLSHEDLQVAARSLHLSGNDLVEVDESYAPGIPDGWELDDLPYSYAAQVTAFTVDRGAFELWDENGTPKLLPSAYGVRIERSDRTAYWPLQNVLKVERRLPPRQAPLEKLATPRPDLCAAMYLGNRFLLISAVPSSAPSYQIEGPSLADELNACLPPSDNNIAENLLLMAAQTEGPLPWSPYQEATKRLKAFLVGTVGLRANDCHPTDGSGLSSHNLTTARAVCGLLAWMRRQSWFLSFRGALARPGIGTLKHRLLGLHFKGKTGSIDRVVSLSGYLRDASGHHLIVSLLFNRFMCSEGKARQVQDRIVKVLAKSCA